MSDVLRKYVRQVLLEQMEVEEPVPSLPKGEWVSVEPGDPLRDSIQEELYNILQQTYEPIGGHFKVKSPGD